MIVILVLAVCGAYGFWTPCPDGSHAPHTINSELCSATTCTVTRGGHLIAEAFWIAQFAHNLLNVSFSTVFLGVTINFPIEPGYEDACFHLRGRTCPTVAQSEYIWDLVSSIPSGKFFFLKFHTHFYNF